MTCVHIGFRQNNFHFAHRYHRQEANEEQEEREENSVGANEGPDIDPGWDKQAPRARQEVAMQPPDDDDEAFEPHAGVNAHADEINDIDVATAPASPKELRRKTVTKEHSYPP